MADLICKNEVFKIIGAAVEVHNEVSAGFLEAVYLEALAIELGLREIPFVEEPTVNVFYKKYALKAYYRPDFLCHDKIAVEIKAIKKCGEVEKAQIINALKVTKFRVGLLINFGEASLFCKRFVN